VNHKQSRSGDGGHFTAQCKIKNTEHWCEYNDKIFQLNNFVNKKSTNKALAKYHPLAYILFYKKKETAATMQIGIQAQQNDEVNLFPMIMTVNKIMMMWISTKSIT
jgi:hypothetical protein